MTSGATAIAIDAPAALSTAPHAEDPTISGKFRSTRCCEIALGREHRLWVPWVTPVAGATVDDWMQLGFRLYRELTTKGHAPIEVYPHAGFRLLSSASLPKKTTMAGVRERVARLEAQGIVAPWMRLWSMMRWMRRSRHYLPCGQSRAQRWRLAAATTTRRSGSRSPVDPAVAAAAPVPTRAYGPGGGSLQRPMPVMASSGSSAAPLVDGQQVHGSVPGLVAEAAAVEGKGLRMRALPQVGGGLVELWVDVAAEDHRGWDGCAGGLEG